MRKSIYLFIIIILSNSCINNFAFYPETVAEAKEKGLLLNEYHFSPNNILINNKEYKIIEAWSGFKFIERNNDEINDNTIAFRFILYDVEKKSDEPNFEIIKFINCNSSFYKYDGLGINDSEFTIFFDKKNSKDIDIIKLEFMSSENEISEVIFSKK